MPELILINIGNTHTQMALWRGQQISRIEQATTRDFVAGGSRGGLLDSLQARPCFVSCVVPHAGSCLRERWPGRQITFLEAGLIRELDLSLVDTSTIGADRLANAMAALEMLKPPFIVLDCGTAMTTVAVDAAQRLRGGAILPGRQLWRLALHEHTAQLPEIELQHTCPVAIGTNTKNAILAGVDMGIIGAVQFILENTQAELDAPHCTTVVTGGDAAYFLTVLPNLIAAPPEFTLRGLARVAAKHFGNSRNP